MYINTVHTLIEQGLQNIGVFAYADFLPEEVDLAINTRQFKMIDEQVEPLRDTKVQKFKYQYIVDRFQNLQVKELPLTPTKGDNCYFVTIPDNYIHLVADISQVLSKCNLTNILTGSIVAGAYYLVTGTKSIIYNTVTYPTGSIFLGVSGITGYTYSGVGNLVLIRLKTSKKANRLTEEEYLFQVLDNSLENTDADSPVSSLSENILTVYVTDFFINKIYLTYIRKPKLVNSKFTTYESTDNLVIDSVYESIDDAITYNGIVYLPFVPFTIVTGHLTFTGSSRVRIQNDGDLEFTDSMSYHLIDKVVEDLSVKTEQNQQKIVNLAQDV